MKIHTLASGATIISTSNHEFRFSDGTIAEPQDREVVDMFTMERRPVKVQEIKGMTFNSTQMVLSEEQQAALHELRAKADIVLIPYTVLDAMYKQGIRHNFPNCGAFNATPETQRSIPSEKIVDLNNWSY